MEGSKRPVQVAGPIHIAAGKAPGVVFTRGVATTVMAGGYPTAVGGAPPPPTRTWPGCAVNHIATSSTSTPRQIVRADLTSSPVAFSPLATSRSTLRSTSAQHLRPSSGSPHVIYSPAAGQQQAMSTPQVTHRRCRSSGEGTLTIVHPSAARIAESPKPVASGTPATAPTPAQGAPKFPRNVDIQGKPFVLEGILGSGSFGTVFSGREEGFGDEVAVKEIRCKSEKDRKQAEYEAELMGLMQQVRFGETDRSNDSFSAQRIACPRLFAVETTATAPSQWTVMLAMEKVAGEPLDDFARKSEHKRGHLDATSLGRELLEQMCPTLARVAKVCLHRDINAHNIMLAADPISPSGASRDQPQSPVFTLIDFGLATDMVAWQEGAWKVNNVGGDCRYWPVSSWKQILFGYKYTAADPRSLSEYMHNLDAHSLALTCIQLVVEVTEGDVPVHSQDLYRAWETYWRDATRFWKQLMAFVRGHSGGDFNKLKSGFLQQQIAETYGGNIQRLRTALTSCAASSIPEHAKFLSVVAEMLSGRRLEWSNIAAQLASIPSESAIPQEPEIRPVKKHTHRRQHTTDSMPALTRHVPEVSVESRIGEVTSPLVTDRLSQTQLDPARSALDLAGLDPSSAGKSHRRAHSQDGNQSDQGFPSSGSMLRPPPSMSLRKITEENFRKTTDDRLM